MSFSESNSSHHDSTNMSSHPSLSLYTLGIFLCALLGAGGMYWYIESTQAHTPQEEVSKNKTLVEHVASHVLLPTNEQPTIATVADPEVLQGQPFFTYAQKGDKVLVYPNAKRAVLYRPLIDKVIEIMPFEPSIRSK